MAIVSNIKPDIIADTENERDVSWPNGTKVYCKDTGKTYTLINGIFTSSIVTIESVRLINDKGEVAGHVQNPWFVQDPAVMKMLGILINEIQELRLELKLLLR